MFKSLLNPITKLMVMVKAYGYGVGPIGLSQFLEQQKVDYLGVANILEGVEIRKAGITTPIMIMKPELDSFDLVMKHNLIPTLFSFHSLTNFIHFIQHKPFKISIKINTGMNRLGFKPDEISALINVLKKHPNIVVESVFSHLVASEEAINDEFTHNQINQFNTIANEFKAQFSYPILFHILNSNGIVRFPSAQMDMVRLGIGLFGLIEEKQLASTLKNVITLKSKIAQLHNVVKGETVGYGKKAIVKINSKIATIPLGYADGFNRKFGNGNWQATLNNNKISTIGNICMDMAMFDVSSCECNENDYIYIINSINDIKKMASQLETIPYEILTAISPRVKRDFL